jgi:endo-1,4-beta-xylanase
VSEEEDNAGISHSHAENICNRLFNYTGTFNVNGWAYLALYGWTTNPLVEYYVIESSKYQTYHMIPKDHILMTLISQWEDTILLTTLLPTTSVISTPTAPPTRSGRRNAPMHPPSSATTRTSNSIGYVHASRSPVCRNTNITQSIRTKMHCGGTINTGNHFRAWEAAGLKLGTQNYMVMGIEGQQGSGDADITVGRLPTVAVPETPTSTYRSVRRTSTRRPTATAITTPTNRPATTTTRRSTSTRRATGSPTTAP